MVSCMRSFLHPYLGKQTETTMQKNATRYIGTFPTNLSCKTMEKGSIKVGLIQQFHSSQWSNFQNKTSKIPDLSTCPLQVALLESRDPAKKKTRHIQARGKNNFAPPHSLFPRKKKKCPPPPFSHAMAFTEAHVEFSVSNWSKNQVTSQNSWSWGSTKVVYPIFAEWVCWAILKTKWLMIRN